MIFLRQKKFGASADDMVSYALIPHIQVIGNSECVVDGLKSVVEYTNQRVKFNMGSYYITFVGADLCINSFSRQGAIVQGNIMSVEFDNYG